MGGGLRLVARRRPGLHTEFFSLLTYLLTTCFFGRDERKRVSYHPNQIQPIYTINTSKIETRSFLVFFLNCEENSPRIHYLPLTTSPSPPKGALSHYYYYLPQIAQKKIKNGCEAGDDRPVCSLGTYYSVIVQRMSELAPMRLRKMCLETKHT